MNGAQTWGTVPSLSVVSYNEMKQLAKNTSVAQLGSREHGIDYRSDSREPLQKTSGLSPNILLTILTTSQPNLNCKDVLKT